MQLFDAAHFSDWLGRLRDLAASPAVLEALLLLFAWGPIPATRTLTGILIIIVLFILGTVMLRRLTAGEFPDAHLTPGMLGAPHEAAPPEETHEHKPS